MTIGRQIPFSAIHGFAFNNNTR